VAGRWAFSVAAQEPGRLKATGAMGGYWDIERTLAAMVLGEHDWEGRTYRYDPDPYGRWIMGANLLPLLAGDTFGSGSDRVRAAEALHLLVRTAGQNGAMARAAVYDRLNAALRDGLPAQVRATWDLLAPRSFDQVQDRTSARELVRQMAAAAVERFPLLASTAGLDEFALPVVLLHGRADRLIPFTETSRLAAHLTAEALRRTTITRLFGTRARGKHGREKPGGHARRNLQPSQQRSNRFLPPLRSDAGAAVDSSLLSRGTGGRADIWGKRVLAEADEGDKHQQSGHWANQPDTEWVVARIPGEEDGREDQRREGGRGLSTMFCVP